jgi:ABC-type dipeptide/oligopeptide/nickel transport system ATPase component
MITHPHLLDIEELKTHFSTFDGMAAAVDNVSFFLEKGEVLGIVGESGCGKSVTALSIMRLIPDPPGKIVVGINLFADWLREELNPRIERHR